VEKLQQPLTFQVFIGLFIHHIPTGILVFLLEWNEVFRNTWTQPDSGCTTALEFQLQQHLLNTTILPRTSLQEGISGSTSRLHGKSVPRARITTNCISHSCPAHWPKTVWDRSSRKGTGLSEHATPNSSFFFSENNDGTAMIQQCIKRFIHKGQSLSHQNYFPIQPKRCFSYITANRSCATRSAGSCLSLQHAGNSPRSSSDRASQFMQGKWGSHAHRTRDTEIPLQHLTSVSGCHLSEAFCCFSFAHTV